MTMVKSSEGAGVGGGHPPVKEFNFRKRRTVMAMCTAHIIERVRTFTNTKQNGNGNGGSKKKKRSEKRNTE